MINVDKAEDKNEEELISKKDLLSLTKISYGQLYRWKRMNIIPEEWFIKKSSPTGQETFFKRDKILERIDRILSMKDNVSLDEIATFFNKKTEEKSVELEDIINKESFSKTAVEVFKTLYPMTKVIERKELIILFMIEKYLLNSMITLDEIKMFAALLEESFLKLYEGEYTLLLYRKYGIAFVVGCKKEEELVIDHHAVKIIEVDLVETLHEISRNLK